jgi:uncharacterized protein (TIRG00374 family)
MSRKRRFSLLKIAVSLVLLVVVFAFTGWREVAGRLAGAQASWLALALGVYVAGVFVRALRWQVLLRGLGARSVSTLRLVALYFVSFFFNSFLPTGIGGDVVRVAEVARAAGAAAAAGSVLADRVVGLVATCVLALLALPLAGAVAPATLWPLGLVALAIAAGVPAGFAFLAQREAGGLAALGRALPFLRRVTEHPKLRETAAALAAYRARDLALALGVSLVFAATNAACYACIGLALGVDLPAAYYAVASPIITLVLLLPISFNGLGTRDGAYQLLFVPAGASPDAALAMSLAYHALNLLTAVAGGAVYAALGAHETLAPGGE